MTANGDDGDLRPSGRNGGASLSDYVADVIQVAKQRGVKYEITGMSTNLEGDLDTLFDIAREMHKASFSEGAPCLHPPQDRRPPR